MDYSRFIVTMDAAAPDAVERYPDGCVVYAPRHVVTLDEILDGADEAPRDPTDFEMLNRRMKGLCQAHLVAWLEYNEFRDGRATIWSIGTIGSKAFIGVQHASAKVYLAAAFTPRTAGIGIDHAIETLLKYGSERFPGELLFGELPRRTVVATPSLVQRQTLLDGYAAFMKRVYAETESALVEAHFADSYEELPLAEVPA